jgi:hypothetical protein
MYKQFRSESNRHFAGVVNGIACYLVVKRLVFDRECSNRSGDVFFFGKKDVGVVDFGCLQFMTFSS